MIQKRLKIVLILSGVMFAGLALIPKTPRMKPSRLLKELPESFSAWSGQPQEPGEREKQILAKDTEFRRMSYANLDGRRPQVEASLVFSGKSVNESIHRPEVCLRAQGWEFVSERNVSFEGVLPSGEMLPLREIVCRRKIMRQESEDAPLEDVLNAEGEPAYRWRLFYYTFIGHEAIVSGHYQRTMQDIRCRIVGGYDQRWAYATFSSSITGKFVEQGFNIHPLDSLSIEETTMHIKEFLQELLPDVIMPPREGVDPSLTTNTNH